MKTKYSLAALVLAALLLVLGGCGAEEPPAADYGSGGAGQASDAGQASGSGQAEDVGETSGPPAVPDPIRALDGAQRDFESGVELEVSGEVFVFDRHVYDFQAPESLTDSSDLLTYKLLCQGAGLGLESMYQDGTYREYALVWEDYVLGYLTTDVGCWTLYIPDSLELDDSPSGSGESSGGSGGISGGFQNDSFGIVVEPGEQVPDSVPQEYRCESCGGSGDCAACGGDGWADNIYYGEHDAFECGVCDGSGDCPVCEGEGVWIIG